MIIGKGLRAAGTAVALGMAALAAPPAFAEVAYPSRPIEVVVPFGPGGGADLMGRQFARMAEEKLGVGMAVVNVAGASGNAGLTRLATNPADGYTLGQVIALTVDAWSAGIGALRPDDFEYVGLLQSSPSMLFLPKDSPYKSFEELAAFAKDNPRKLRVATSGYGTPDDITLKYLGTKGLKFINVPFGKPAERYASTVGRHTDALYEEPGDVAQFVQSGDLRPVIVFDDKRHPAFPDVPASRELGYAISDLPNFRTIAVRAGTPGPIVDKLTQATREIAATPEWRKFCERTYTCTPDMPPAQVKALVSATYEKAKAYLAEFKAAQ